MPIKKLYDIFSCKKKQSLTNVIIFTY